jgi:hypothetical protein
VPDIEDILLKNFVDLLLWSTANNLNDRDREFMGVPLQSMFLAEAFEGNLKTCPQTCVPELPQKLNVLQLYDRFVEQKFKIVRDKNRIDIKIPQTKKDLAVNGTGLQRGP